MLVAERAAVAPASLAVVDCTRSVPGHNSQLTYGELEEHANRLANRLRSLGARPETVVGLCFGRSIGFVVGALGIVKSGAAYLPINPKSPVSQREFQLRDAAADIIVTDQDFVEEFATSERRAVSLDHEGHALSTAGKPGTRVQELDRAAMAAARTSSNTAAGGCSAPDCAWDSDTLAYVIYTSGSTGEPKGVEITHGSLANLVRWHQRAFGVGPGDRTTLLANVEFDASVWEMWSALSAGATLYIPDHSTRQDPGALHDWLLAQKITVSFVPTPMAEQLMSLSWPTDAKLRILLTGGDTLHAHPSYALPFLLVNNYGPTECTVVATSGALLPRQRPDALPPIGRAIANVDIRILDEGGRPVKAGETGEIFIGGLGVARGYRNQPELTRQRFLADPLSDNPSARLYRTGDLGKFLPNGEIAFLGRIDDQIKVRGFRIEPGAIVAALNQHPAVKQSAAAAREYGPGDKRLVAYVVCEPDAAITHGDLRNHLAARLPEQMIPGVFVKIGALPLNSSGKIDRAALPEPNSSNSFPSDQYLAPRTPTEKRLTEILAALLEVERVSVDDNFFMLGGHSLLGTQLIARISGAFGVELSLRTLFESPSIAALAAEVNRALLSAYGEPEQKALTPPNHGSPANRLSPRA
jgi:amino acid adenylation domain-containing protein